MINIAVNNNKLLNTNGCIRSFTDIYKVCLKIKKYILIYIVLFFLAQNSIPVVIKWTRLMENANWIGTNFFFYFSSIFWKKYVFFVSIFCEKVFLFT